MTKLDGRVCVVTGAASGIGRALANELGRRGAKLAISDVDDAGLQSARSELEAAGVDVMAEPFDVSDRAAFEAHAQKVVERFGTAHVIVNNAGVSLRVMVQDMTYEDFEWLMGINFWGVVYGTKTFLPILESNDWGHIVNISSIFGIIGVPTQSAYNAAKFAVRGFTEALNEELLMSDSNVGITSVHPGGIKTNIVRNGRVLELSGFEDKHDPVSSFDRLAQTSSEDAARHIADAIDAGRERLLIGTDAKLIDVLQRLMPTRYKKLVVKQFMRNVRHRG